MSSVVERMACSTFGVSNAQGTVKRTSLYLVLTRTGASDRVCDVDVALVTIQQQRHVHVPNSPKNHTLSRVIERGYRPSSLVTNG